MSRVYTEAEIRDKFIAQVWTLINYWETVDGENKSTRDRLSGLVHSLLAALDGNSIALPGFTVAPSPHPEDREFNINEGENYYPETNEYVDIGGSLHERLYIWARENGVRL